MLDIRLSMAICSSPSAVILVRLQHAQRQNTIFAYGTGGCDAAVRLFPVFIAVKAGRLLVLLMKRLIERPRKCHLCRPFFAFCAVKYYARAR